MKVIFIISFSPVYEYLREAEIPIKSLKCWLNINNQYIAIWDKDWGVIIGDELLKIKPEWQYEVWRPDRRADKIYDYTKKNGLILRSFPSATVKVRRGLKTIFQEYSDLLVNALEELYHRQEKFIIILPITNQVIFNKIYTKFEKLVPILNPHFTNNETLLCRTKLSMNPGRILHRFIVNSNFKKILRRLKYVTLPQVKYSRQLEVKYGWNISNFAAGFDPEDHPRDLQKCKAREILGINKDDFVLLCSSRIVPEKQIDYLLRVLSRLVGLKWKCYITGSGPENYVKLIMELHRSLHLEERVVFVGYISDEKLKNYYIASDLFFMTSAMEAGPGSANLAVWYGLPVISTRTGSVAELLEQQGAGYLVDPKNYREWEEALRFAFQGNTIKLMDEKILLLHKSRKNNMGRLAETIEKSAIAFYNI